MTINVSNDFVVTKFVITKFVMIYLIMMFYYLNVTCLVKISIAYVCIGFIKCACLISKPDNDYLTCQIVLAAGYSNRKNVKCQRQLQDWFRRDQLVKKRAYPQVDSQLPGPPISPKLPRLRPELFEVETRPTYGPKAKPYLGLGQLDDTSFKLMLNEVLNSKLYAQYQNT